MIDLADRHIDEHAKVKNKPCSDRRTATQVLVRYRPKITGERPMVVYCSMARKSWLQPAGEIGNPYHGRSMEKCGEVVEK